MVRKEKTKKWKKYTINLLFAALLFGSATGCGNSSEKNAYDVNTMYDENVKSDSLGLNHYETEGAEDNADVEEESGSSVATDQSEQTFQGNDKRKIIKRYQFEYETEKFDDAFLYLKQTIDSYNGYVESSSIQGKEQRNLYLIARIPADQSDLFVGELGNLGTVLSQSESAEDITLQYADTESRITSLKTEQERLLKLLEEADSLENIIALEDRLTQVRYELENYESQRKLYDDQVNYSTITIHLSEVSYVVAVDDGSFFSKIKTGLERSVRDVQNGFVNFIIFLIVNLPYFIVWGLIILFIIWCIRKVRNRIRHKKGNKQKMKEKKSKVHRRESDEQGNREEEKEETK